MRSLVVLGISVMLALVASSCSSDTSQAVATGAPVVGGDAAVADDAAPVEAVGYATAAGDTFDFDGLEGPAVVIFWDPG